MFTDSFTNSSDKLTGESKILVGVDAKRLLPHSNLAIRITVHAAQFVQSCLPFSGALIDYSPYNPPVRSLVTETPRKVGVLDSTPSSTATLVRKETLSDLVTRFTFKVDSSGPIKPWLPGQHATFDFSDELDIGYMHMNNNDPQSLNDDFVRTFTITNLAPEGDKLPAGAELEITARRHGPATDLLRKTNIRAELSIPLLGFGGEEKFRIKSAVGEDTTAVFIAGGVGITPILSQAREILKSKIPLRALWSTRADDLPFVVDIMERNPELTPALHLFVSGTVGDEDKGSLDKLNGSLGAAVVFRRIQKEDALFSDVGKKKFFLCANPVFLKEMLGWLEGNEVVWEDFGY